MSLIKCPECGREISDKAEMCIGCGYPIKEYFANINEDVQKEIEKHEVAEEMEINPYKKCPKCGSHQKVNVFTCPTCKIYLGKNDIVIKKEYLDKIYVNLNGDRVLLENVFIKGLAFSKKEAKNIITEYLKTELPPKHEVPTEKNKMGNIAVPHFNGIYRYTMGKRVEVYCPRCGSEDCSHHQEQRVIPAQTKTRYTANLNPLRPFTLVNKKEKVVKYGKTITENKIICNKCGMIFQ